MRQGQPNSWITPRATLCNQSPEHETSSSDSADNSSSYQLRTYVRTYTQISPEITVHQCVWYRHVNTYVRIYIGTHTYLRT